MRLLGGSLRHAATNGLHQPCGPCSASAPTCSGWEYLLGPDSASKA